MKCELLLMGGGGFIGSHIARAAVGRGLKVRVFDQQVSPYVELPCSVEVVLGDWSDRDALALAMAGCDAVVHLISRSVPVDALTLPAEIDGNVVPALGLLDVLSKTGVRNLVFASSGGTVYGDSGPGPLSETDGRLPRCSYGLGKVLVEQCLRFQARQTGTAVTILRPSNPYGPGQSPIGRQGAIPIFLRKVALGEEILLFGDPVRDFVYVADVADAFVRAACAPQATRVLNVGSGQGNKLSHVLSLVERTVGRRARLRRVASRGCDVASNVLAIDRIRQDLDWSPATSLAEGIARTWSWVETVIR